jgi:hypothetical protein
MKKSKSNSKKIWKIQKKSNLKCEMIWKILTVMISPLCTNCHDVTVILLNVALNTINLIFNLQRHIPTYLYIYIFMRIIDFIHFICWLFSYLFEFQMSTIKFILHNSLTQCSIFRAVRKLTS